MISYLQKWGNSLAIRIPKSLADEAGLDIGSPVAIALKSGKLIISPINAPIYTLEDLLAQITENNIHIGVDTGPAAGKEDW